MAVRTWHRGMVPSGVGGHAIATAWGSQSNGSVWFLDNSSAYSGTGGGYDYSLPNSELTELLKLVSAGDIIVIGAGHAESGSWTINVDRLTIFGLGSSAACPTFTGSGSNTLASTWNITGDGVRVYGIKLANKVNLETNTQTTILDINASYVTVSDCIILNTTNSDDACTSCVRVGNSTASPYCTIDDCTITNVCTATTITQAFAYHATNGILLDGSAANVYSFRCTDCTISSSYGFHNGAIYSTLAALNYWIEDPTLGTNDYIIFTSASARGIVLTAGGEAASRVQTAASTRTYPNGLTGAARGGSPYLYAEYLITTGVVYYVDNSNSRASDDNSGVEYNTPKASITTATTGAYATATADNGDIIVVCENHEEEGALAASKNGIKIWGVGDGAYRPSWTYDATTPATDMIEVTGAAMEIRGFEFPAMAGAVDAAVIDVSAPGFLLEGCDLTCGEYDTSKVYLDATSLGYSITNNTWTVDASTTRPLVAIASAVLGGCNWIEDNHFDGENVGWSTAAVSLAGTDHCIIYDNVFLDQANLRINSSLGGVCIVSDNDWDDDCRIWWTIA